MFSKGETKVLEFVLKLSTNLYACPYDWYSNSPQLIVTKRKWKLIISFILCYWKLLYLLLNLLQFFPATQFGCCDNSRLEKKVFHGIMFACMVLIFAEMFTCYFYRDEVSLLYNSLRAYNKKAGNNKITKLYDCSPVHY